MQGLHGSVMEVADEYVLVSHFSQAVSLVGVPVMI